MSVRAKFKVDSVASTVSSTSVVLVPVYGSSDENKAFWEATPAGRIEMSITNKAAADTFEVGKEYYVDFSEVAEPCDYEAANE